MMQNVNDRARLKLRAVDNRMLNYIKIDAVFTQYDAIYILLNDLISKQIK